MRHKLYGYSFHTSSGLAFVPLRLRRQKLVLK